MTKPIASYLDNIVSDIEPVESVLDSLLDDTASDVVNPDDILRVNDVKDKSLKWFIDQMANGNALLFYGRAYKLFKRMLSDDNNYKAEMIREDERAWLESRWVSQGNPDIHVDFRVPLYENDKGFTVTGKRVTLDGWID